MQVTINLEQELLEAAQKKAQFQKTSLDHAMSQLLRLGLASDIITSSSDGKTPFTFSLPGGLVTSDDVKAVVENDDE